MERRIAAILAADMVGYSRLMEADETGTLERQKRHRIELIDPKIDAHHGHIIKLTGDGMIAEFPSVVEAVHCAVSIQEAMEAREEDVSDDRKIRYRVAVNLGDVIFDEGDIYGDGVNIAARLEELAPAGGVVVSGTAYDHLKANVEVGYEDLGEKRVKNISTPVRVYRVVPGGQPMVSSARTFPFKAGISVAAIVLLAALLIWRPWEPEFAPASVDQMSHPLPDKPSLVVLPFEDFSDNPEHAFFADGITEDLITDLSKLSGIFVISRNSSWTYKDRAVKSQEVAEELGVQYILEGSLRRAGDQVRVNAQLIDALSGHHIWADRYDSSVQQVFELQDQVLQEITSALAVQLTAKERQGLGATETEHPEAYDAVLYGLELLRSGNSDDTLIAISKFEDAIAIDPDYHRAYAALAAAHWRIVQSVWFLAMGGGFERSWKEVERSLEKAMEAPSALAYSVQAEILVEQGRHAEAYNEIDKALALSPNDPDIHLVKAKVLNATGRAHEAEAAVRYALRYDPLEPTRYLRELGVSQLHQKNYQDAVSTMRRVLKRNSDIVADITTLTSALGHLGQLDDVPELIEQYDALAVPSYYDPFTAEESLIWWYGDMYGYDPDYRRHLYDGVVKAGVPASAGSDLDYDEVADLIKRDEGLYYPESIPRINTEEAHALWKKGEAQFVDVRALLDFNAGHIPNSVNYSLMVELSREALLEIANLDDTLVFSCHGPHCPYSAYAAVKAQLWGFRDARYYSGGFPDWVEQGLPTATIEQN
ncbi:rhodanese-like domain-containing protein [Ruegeria arenilitoris]|uniref:rhodanese-like domain-containing protein n=1 Tax=Ruegeria arenilitoris TaxID=1173585 RepID=UPI00147D9FB1|nr:rhodanese-like domain-containing protein [Ruegeria arenilitoris]